MKLIHNIPVLLTLALAACSSKPALPSFGVVPEFVLTDQTGQPFRSKDALNGNVWVADFIFTNCMGPCPRMSGQMKQVRDAFKDQPAVKMASFTIDPERDTPEALAAYAKRYHADPNQWHFLTGSRADLRKLSWDAIHLGDVNGQLDHSTRFVLIDQKSRIRGYYDTSESESIPKLMEDIKTVMKESF